MVATTGQVYLVGTGPGDPDLLTVKAARLLRGAEVVVYDRLVAEEILACLPSGASRIFVGKRSGRHPVPQAEINTLLVRLARTGHRVLRLKGGDPFVFGRGSEEAEYLVRHGIPFEVVPGITSASACACYAGIPLTHRGLASGVQFVTGHARGDAPLALDWRKLADPDRTLVIYMGLATIEQIVGELIKAGLSPDMPSAAIEQGTTRRQRRLLTRLADLPRQVNEQGYVPPVLFVVGRVVSLAGTLDWFQPEMAVAEAVAEREGHG